MFGKHDRLFRDPTFLSQKELTFLNLREPMCLSAAEDGRKRATALPPLDREPTFQRKPKYFNPYDGSNDDAAESHWKKKYERVSIEVDSKIKHHLKKQLLTRFEKRMKKMNEALSEETDGRHGNEYSPWDGKPHKHKHKEPESKDIFSKYTETGAKTTQRQTLKENSLPKINTTQGNSNLQSGSKVQFPDIDHNGEHSPVNNDSLMNGDAIDGDRRLSSAENEGFSLTRLKERYAETIEGFRTLDISPVQTPKVVRPLTREQTRLSFDDRRKRILNGQVHLTCPANSKVVSVYLSAGFGDSEAERTILSERLFPELQALCAVHGREFRLIDPHWGLRDGVTDDHSLAGICVAHVEKCTKDQLQAVNMVVLLTDKYGDVILPNEMGVDDFETTYRNICNYTQTEQQKIQQQLAQLENTGVKKVSVTQMQQDTNEKNQNEAEGHVTESSKKTSESKGHSGDKSDNMPTGNVMATATDLKKEQQEMIKRLKERKNELPDPEILTTWYQLDENAVPHMYRLQNISSILKDFAKGDKTRKEHALQQWSDISSRLLNMLQVFGPKGREDAFKSVLELELEHGLGDPDLNQCLVIHRTIEDLCANYDDLKADCYADVTSGAPRRLRSDLQIRLENLRDNVIQQKVPDYDVMSFTTNWAPGGIRIGGDRAHQTYLDRMAKQVGDVIKSRLWQSFREEQKAGQDNSDVFDEIVEHVTFYQERSRHFQGMKDSLQILKAYVRSCCPSLLVVHGKPGSGKSALLSKAAKETHKWLRGHDAAVLVRSVGMTKTSTNVRGLLHDLCRQLCIIYDCSQDEVPTDFVGLINDFENRLSLASEEKPLVIYLDALDRLEDDYNGRQLTWLPKVLPEHVHLIVSTLSDETIECMPSLKSLLGEGADMFLEIPELHESDAMIIFHHWCNVHNRNVTEQQFDVIMDKFKKCPSPLFLKMLFNEALSWSSTTEVQESKLPDNVKKLAGFKFGQMEVKHGESLVRRALGYLTAARNGVTDQEMVDLLSLDDAVSEITSANHLVRRRFPPSLWLRLRQDISIYVRECKSDNVRTLQWAHSHFYQAAKYRYLKQKDKAPSYHKIMAEYFLGMWVEKKKPYPGNDTGALRHVPPQPMYWEKPDHVKDGSEKVYNLRKINELPHHLLYSNQTQLYKSEAMCNFEWVLSKLCATSLRALVEEYHIGLEMEPSDADLKILSDTFQLSATAILRDPRQLAGQVLGRLQGIVLRDVPVAPGDPPKYPFLHAFVAQAKNTSTPALVPSIGCLTEPGGILYDLLSGHTKAITAVTSTTDAIRALTASEDNTLKIWDLKSGKVTSTIYNFGTNVTRLRTALNNKFVVAVEGEVIKVWEMRTKECRLVVDQYLDPPVIAIAGEGKLLVALIDGVNILRTWDMEHDFRFVCEAKIEDNSVYSDNSVILAPDSFGDYVLHAFRGNNAATIQHARTGKVIHQLKCNDTSSSIVALQITRDYMILVCRQQYMKLHEIHQLEMFDAKKGKYLRSIRGCTQDNITELHINLVGSHGIAVCASETTNSSNIMIWNLETEDHKHLAKHSGVSTISACADFRFCLTAQKGDNTLKIWNISKFINQPMPKLKKSLGVAEIHPMVDNPRYAIARQVNHGPVSIWNVAKAKCLANAVRIERGLSESSDVVLIRNWYVVILTEKALKDSKPVFKTVLTYDLRAKRYIKRVTGCFIVPSPQHEYMLLDDETLLGPAENRNHFIIWNITTGREMFRIRPKFKELEHKQSISETELEHSLKLRASTAKMTPWDRRSESHSARKRRREKDRDEERKNMEELHKEKENAIEQFIISGDLKVIVASFYAHHLVVLNIVTKLHTQTLEDQHSMLFLHVSALNHDGSHLVHANYDESCKVSYVTLWNTESGEVKKRLKNESDVLAIAITDDASRVVFGKANKELRIWDPDKTGPNSMKKIKGYESLEFGVNSKIFLLSNGQRAVVFAGDLSLWDLESATLLAVFTPDTRIECLTVVMNGNLIAMGVHEYPELVVLKMVGKGVKEFVDVEHEDLFGETTGDTSDEEEDEDDDI